MTKTQKQQTELARVHDAFFYESLLPLLAKKGFDYDIAHEGIYITLTRLVDNRGRDCSAKKIKGMILGLWRRRLITKYLVSLTFGASRKEYLRDTITQAINTVRASNTTGTIRLYQLIYDTLGREPREKPRDNVRSEVCSLPFLYKWFLLEEDLSSAVYGASGD